jgi:hypothetical protein
VEIPKRDYLYAGFEEGFYDAMARNAEPKLLGECAHHIFVQHKEHTSSSIETFTRRVPYGVPSVIAKAAKAPPPRNFREFLTPAKLGLFEREKFEDPVQANKNRVGRIVKMDGVEWFLGTDPLEVEGWELGWEFANSLTQQATPESGEQP